MPDSRKLPKLVTTEGLKILVEREAAVVGSGHPRCIVPEFLRKPNRPGKAFAPQSRNCLFVKLVVRN
jgi:hypothetical protein